MAQSDQNVRHSLWYLHFLELIHTIRKSVFPHPHHFWQEAQNSLPRLVFGYVQNHIDDNWPL